MLKKRFMIALGLLMVMSMVLSACGSATPTAAPATEAPTAGPTAVPAVTRTGGWLDEINFSVVSSDSAVTQLNAGAIDIYAGGLAANNLQAIKDAKLSYGTSNGLYYDMMYNPAVFKDANTLNPFSDRKIREATNWLYDRNYINQEIYAGGALAKFFPIQTNGPEYADLADVARGLEAKYAYNPDKAKQVISAEMTTLGATLGADGKWQFKGKPVTIIFLVRPDSDGTRKPIGDYLTKQLASVGFTVDEQYKKSSEASPLWIGSNPADGKWGAYTAAWSSTAITRDEKDMFQQMYLPSSVQGIQPFLSDVPDPAFQKLGDDLASANFKSMDDRRQMMAQALDLSFQDSLQVWLIDGKNFAPYSSKVQATSDLAAGIETAQVSPHTLRFTGQEGGKLKWGEPDLFSDPWNPVAGDNWTFDHAAYGMTQDGGTMYDPYTGLLWPLRVEKGDVTVQTGLSVTKTLDWVTLNTADKITVPADANVDWDVKTQKFITAGDAAAAKGKVDQFVSKVTDAAGAVDFAKFDATAFGKLLTDLGTQYSQATGSTVDVATALKDKATQTSLSDELKKIKGLKTPDEQKAELASFAKSFVGTMDSGMTYKLGVRDVSTAKVKSVATYPADLFDKVKWQDGSPLSVADFVMPMILSFEQANAASTIYDAATVPIHEQFMSTFKGFKIASTNPLTIEWYTDYYARDAELNVYTMWPGTYAGAAISYGYGDAGWDMIAVSNLAVANKELAYSADAADANKVEWMSWIGGPSLDILSKHLAEAQSQSLVPFAPTLGQYITADQAKARYDNLAAWYKAHGHYWVGDGPYILDKVFLTEKTLTLKNNPLYSDLADRWANFGEPKLADATLDGPGQVKIGDQAVFDINVSFKGDPYPQAEIKQVKYLLYDATGAVVGSGAATAVADGHYQVTLGADVTSKLTAGSDKIEIAVIPLPVSVPTFTSLDFVTVP